MKPIRVLLPLLLLALAFSMLPTHTLQAQILKKLKEKAEQVMGTNQDDKKVEESNTTDNQDNTGQKGKKLTPPDVKLLLTDAGTAAKEQRYADAKFNIQQALAGVELEIGYAILESLPQNISSMKYAPDEDQVTSSGAGFIGLMIGRNYKGGKKSINAGIVNNSMLAAAYGTMLSGSTYNSNDQSQKPITVDGNRGVLKYDDGDYELGIPLGQSSVFTLQCRGFADENEVLNVAKQFKINNIKKLLGEQ